MNQGSAVKVSDYSPIAVPWPVRQLQLERFVAANWERLIIGEGGALYWIGAGE